MKVDPTDLDPQFFDRDAKRVARELIGCYLVCRRNSNLLKHKITETEAYAGPTRPCLPLSKGRAERTETMFGPPGILLGSHVAPEHRMSGSPHLGMPICWMSFGATAILSTTFGKI